MRSRPKPLPFEARGRGKVDVSQRFATQRGGPPARLSPCVLRIAQRTRRLRSGGPLPVVLRGQRIAFGHQHAQSDHEEESAARSRSGKVGVDRGGGIHSRRDSPHSRRQARREEYEAGHRDWPLGSAPSRRGRQTRFHRQPTDEGEGGARGGARRTQAEPEAVAREFARPTEGVARDGVETRSLEAGENVRRAAPQGRRIEQPVGGGAPCSGHAETPRGGQAVVATSASGCWR